MLGTVGYMSPEQVRGLPVDHRTDIFSFGCLLSELLSGRAPFRRDTAAETMTAILRDEPPDLSATAPGVSPALERVVKRCLEKEPGQRFSSAHDLALALEAVSAPFEPGARTAAAQTASRPTRRRLLASLAALLAVAAAGAGIAIAYLAGKKAATLPVPSFQRLTFRQGWVNAARFAPDGQTVIYSAAWEGGPNEVFSLQLGRPESRRLGHSPAELLAVSRTGWLALNLDSRTAKSTLWRAGTLARVPLSGGSPRPLSEDVTFADWSPDGKALAIVRETDKLDHLEYPIGSILASGVALNSARLSPSGDAVAFIESPSNFWEGAVAMVDRHAAKPRPLTPEGVGVLRPLPISPDGTFVLGVGGGMGLAGRTVLAYPVAGGAPRPFKGLVNRERIAGWGPGGRWFFTVAEQTGRMYRVDTATGARTLVHEISVADWSGRWIGFWAKTTPDGKAYVYTIAVLRSELFLVEGLR